MTPHIELNVHNRTLKDGVPTPVIETLKYLTRTTDYEFDEFPDDFLLKLEEKEQWKDILRSSENFFFDTSYGVGSIYFHYCNIESGFYVLAPKIKDVTPDKFTYYYLFLKWVAKYLHFSQEEEDEVLAWIIRHNMARSRMTTIYFHNSRFFFKDDSEQIFELDETTLDKFVWGE